MDVPDGRLSRIVARCRDDDPGSRYASVAEVDDNDSLGYATLAAAVVSNSRSHGESVLAKALAFAEENASARVSDVAVTSEVFD